MFYLNLFLWNQFKWLNVGSGKWMGAVQVTQFTEAYICHQVSINKEKMSTLTFRYIISYGVTCEEETLIEIKACYLIFNGELLKP